MAKLLAKGIATKKDSTKAIETKAGVMKDSKSVPKISYAIQFLDGREYTEKDILKKVKEIWTKTYKNKVGDIRTVDLYVKQEESAVYFVINGETSDKIEL